MKYLSLFSGIGGFELGIQNAYGSQKRGVQENTQGVAEARQGLLTSKGQNITATHRRISERITDEPDQRPLCVGYSEIDKYAIQTYERHFNHENYGSATTINPKELPDFDLLVGGFPCQAFSIAGKRAGFNDTRGTLFFDIARILAEKRPRHLVLENVKGLLSHDSGKTFQTILGVLTDLGYRVEWQVLNSKDFGVPQNRERVYIVGHLGDECRGQVFPIDHSDTKTKSGRITATQWRRTELGKEYRRESQKRGEDKTPFNKGYRELVEKPNSPIGTVTSQAIAKDSLLSHDFRVRRLTPVECERLQGFPDGWTAGESDTQRYKMCGNAVTVNVVEVVMRSLFNNCLPTKDNEGAE